MKRCFVRFDDVCPTMDSKQFMRGMDLMFQFNIKPLLGVIPLNEDPEQMIEEPNTEFWEMIRYYEKRGFLIAMHGYKHVYDSERPNTIICGKKHSEFAGHSFEEQLNRIVEGKRILKQHGIDTDIFFAPGHTYDEKTLLALKKAGFKYISDGMSNKPYVQCGIKCLPCKSFGVSRRKRGINVGVNHSNEWSNNEKEYEKLRDFCEEAQNSSFHNLLITKTGFYFSQKFAEQINKFVFFVIKPFLRKLLFRQK